MDLEASEPRCRCCCRCRGRPDNDKKTTTTATKKTTTTATNRFLVSRCADVFALPLYLACLFSLSPAGCRLLASASHLLTCACWLPAPAYCLLPVGFHLQPFHCVLDGFSVFTYSCSYVQVAHCFGGFAPEQKVDKTLETHELLST